MDGHKHKGQLGVLFRDAINTVSPVKERVLFMSTLTLLNVGRNRLYSITKKKGRIGDEAIEFFS
jgi:hypothetical protein